ncbi:hypothetical protein RB195_014374 [Necator americanus]|uniref:Uncharacterized protein n=1 Tax=Necator americanus TaxID=51031 RepID=A0ABR1E0A9_NECAM
MLGPSLHFAMVPLRFQLYRLHRAASRATAPGFLAFTSEYICEKNGCFIVRCNEKLFGNGALNFGTSIMAVTLHCLVLMLLLNSKPGNIVRNRLQKERRENPNKKGKGK